MGVKEQLKKVKDNWLLIALALVILVVFGGDIIQESVRSIGGYSGGISSDIDYAPSAERYATQSAKFYEPGEGFAPDVQERKITKNAYLSTEVETGTFESSATKVKAIINSSNSILLNEQVNRYETERNSYYYTGDYEIKVTVKKYDSVIAKLKEIGEVKSFDENQRDITEESMDMQIELETEQARLKRYEDVYKETTEVSDKIELTNLIFNQERTIEYLKESLANINKKVEYSTINLRITEKKSDYADIVFVKFSDLMKGLLGSFNALIVFVFWVAPWAIAAIIVRYIWKRMSKRK